MLTIPHVAAFTGVDGTLGWGVHVFSLSHELRDKTDKKEVLTPQNIIMTCVMAWPHIVGLLSAQVPPSS